MTADGFYVWRRPTRPLALPAKLPRRRHPTLADACAEATRLHRLQPDDTFQVVQVLAEIGPEAS